MRPSSCSGSSEWITPRPAVIHCTPPFEQQAFVAGAVAMAHAPGDHVGDRLEAAVRMVRKAADVVLRIVGAERVEHQERIEPSLQRLRQHARQLDAGAVGRGLAGDHALDACEVWRPSRSPEVGSCRRHAMLLGRCGRGLQAATASSICACAAASAALLGIRSHRQPFGVHEVDVGHAEEREHGLEVRHLRVGRRVAVLAAARERDVDLLALEQSLRATRRVAERHLRPRDRVDPVLELRRHAEVVHRHAQHHHICGPDLRNQRIVERARVRPARASAGLRA